MSLLTTALLASNSSANLNPTTAMHRKPYKKMKGFWISTFLSFWEPFEYSLGPYWMIEESPLPNIICSFIVYFLKTSILILPASLSVQFT